MTYTVIYQTDGKCSRKSLGPEWVPCRDYHYNHPVRLDVGYRGGGVEERVVGSTTGGRGVTVLKSSRLPVYPGKGTSEVRGDGNPCGPAVGG